MYIFSALKKGRQASAFLLPENRERIQNYLFLFLFFGVTAGCIIGSYADVGRLTTSAVFGLGADHKASFFEALLYEGRYFFLILICSSTYLGVLLVPALLIMFGGTFGAVVAAAFAADYFPGILRTGVLYGVPALIVFTPFMLQAADCIMFSRDLLLFRFTRYPVSEKTSYSFQHLLLATFAVFIVAAYRYFLLPLLI